MAYFDKLFSDLKPWAIDTGERSVKTFIQVFVLQLVAAGWFTMEGIIDYSIPQKAALAAGGAGLSIISSALSKLFGSPDSASMVSAVHSIVGHGNNGDNV
jgi:uncharacterized membrane protein HdeD (DUF308 family)